MAVETKSLKFSKAMISRNEEGEIDLVNYLKKFNGSYVKIQITDKTEETVEE